MKLHTLLDLRGNIPVFIHISDGKMHAVNVLDQLMPEPLQEVTAENNTMHDFPTARVLAAVILAPFAVNAADSQAELLHRANTYAFDSTLYGAAGKPFTNAIAKRYARWSRYYRERTSATHADR